MATVRYLVTDVDARAFYRDSSSSSGFDMLPAFAWSAAATSTVAAARRRPPPADARRPVPARRLEPVRRRGRRPRRVVERLRDAGAAFRNDIVNGPGGRQILVDDPDGNPIELFEARE